MSAWPLLPVLALEEREFESMRDKEEEVVLGEREEEQDDKAISERGQRVEAM